MENNEQTNKVKILKELQKNGRGSISELAEKTGLTRQTIAKTIKNMENKKEIWGYSAIFDPKLIGKIPFMFLVKFNLVNKSEEFLKIATNPKQVKDNEEIFGFNTSLFLNGSSDMLIIILANDIIDAIKHKNNILRFYGKYVEKIEMFDIMSIFRNNNISNPKMSEEWRNLII